MRLLHWFLLQEEEVDNSNNLMKYLLVFFVSIFVFSCEKAEVVAPPKNKPTNLVVELNSLNLPVGSKIIEESDGGGRMIGYYQWYIEIPNQLLKPKGRDYFFLDRVNSKELVLQIVNTSKHLDLDDSEVLTYWSAVWTPTASKYGYTFIVAPVFVGVVWTPTASKYSYTFIVAPVFAGVVWTPTVSKYSYTLSAISTQKKKSFLRVQRYIKN